ncbi:MAG: YtxH domain-containing protein [Anaerolineae bacterium]|nr:YtxH domain-containing protein [Anaerolineae bacterium]
MSSNRIYYSREAEMQANREKTIAVILFLAFGLGVGAVLALLFAPRSGEQVRHEIGHALEDRFGNVEQELSGRFSRMEKDFSELSKRVDERLSELRK